MTAQSPGILGVTVGSEHEVDLSMTTMSLADERAWLRCLDGYVGSGGSEWVGGETDSDDDYYFPGGGSDGDDCDA